MNPALQGYLAAVVESLTGDGTLDGAADEVQAVVDLVEGSPALDSVVDDGALPVATRRAVLDDLLAGKVRDQVARLVHQTVTLVPAAEVATALHWLVNRLREVADLATRDHGRVVLDEPAAGRTAARNRVWGYAAAVFEDESIEGLEGIEDELFRFARIVESNRPLRAALGDRDLPVAERQGLAAALLAGKVSEASARLVAYAIRGGRARDFVATVDSLVEAAASARGWRVAKVRSAEDVADDQQQALSRALGTLTGGPVELQVTLDAGLLAGAVVEVGDLLVDGSVRHRLDQLGEQLAQLGSGPTTRSAPLTREESSR